MWAKRFADAEHKSSVTWTICNVWWIRLIKKIKILLLPFRVNHLTLGERESSVKRLKRETEAQVKPVESSRRPCVITGLNHHFRLQNVFLLFMSSPGMARKVDCRQLWWETLVWESILRHPHTPAQYGLSSGQPASPNLWADSSWLVS